MLLSASLTVVSTVVEALKILSTMLFYTSLLFTLLVLAKPADSTVDTFFCLNKASAQDLENMSLRSFDGSVDRYTEVPISRASDLMSKIDPNKDTVIYVHGYVEFADAQNIAELIDAYLSRGSFNVIRLNWDTISNNLYDYSACSTPGVGSSLGDAMSSMVASGLNKNTLSLVGHSLGAQIIGFAARAANFIVELLIGLDPANPGFNTLMPHLAAGDGKFVFIVHTDRGGFGIDLQTGDADLYPNDGNSVQPGCITLDICSHTRAVNYWAECVRNQGAFYACKCDSWDDFKAGLCELNEVIEIGPGMPTNATGRYYLQSNGESPYGRGENSTVHE